MLRTLYLTTLVVLTAPALAHAQDGADPEGSKLPRVTFTDDQVWTIISPDLGDTARNQPLVVDGRLLLAGNAEFDLYAIDDPFRPELLSSFTSPHADGEAESHQVASARLDDGRVVAVTISGLGVDLWDLTEPTEPTLLKAVELEGVRYGDNSEAVWGVAWQGDAVYAGGTNTGLHVIDASVPEEATVVTRVPSSALGGVSIGPITAVGNLLVATTPKSHRGVATIDISDPWDPILLDAVIPDEKNSYIGGFHGTSAYLITPFRTYDVTTDPSDITLTSSTPLLKSEYFTFDAGHLFLGVLRPTGGIVKYDLADAASPQQVGWLSSRKDDPAEGFLTDDQFGLPIGNLLVMCDDEIRYGCVIGVHQAAADDTAPEVAYVNPVDGATGIAPTSRIGISFTDQMDDRSLDTEHFVVRPLGGEPLTGHWGVSQTVVSFWPSEPLDPDTTYEVELPAGGVADLSGNTLGQTFRSTFATGDEVVRLGCTVGALAPVEVGTPTPLIPADDDGATSWTWSVDGAEHTGRAPSVTFDTPGRRAVTLEVSADGGSRRCTGTQIVHAPLLPRVPPRSSTLATTGDTAWVVVEDADAVVQVSLADGTALQEIAVGDRPRTVALDDQGRVWVANADSDDVVVLDADGTFVASIALPWGSQPYGVAPAFDGQAVHVTLEGSGGLAVIDPEALTLTEVIPLGPDADGLPVVPRGIATTPDGHALVTRFVSSAAQGEVWVVPVDGGEPTVVPLAIDQSPDEHDAGRGVPNYLSSIAVSPDGTRAAIPSKKDNILRGGARDGEALDSDNTVRTIVSQLDLLGGEEIPEVRVDLDDHDMAFAATYSPLGDLLYAVSQGTNQVDVLDAHTGDRIGGFTTGLAPQGVVRAEGDLLVTHDTTSRTLSVFDVADLEAGIDTRALRVATIELLADEPLSETLLLGKQLFHNADSRQMSQDGYLSCATCHQDGTGDGMVWDFTDRGEGLRNTIDLRGKAGTKHGPVHWSANFDEIQDFEHDIRFAFGGAGLMSTDDFEADGHDDPLGTKKAGVSERLDALAAYTASFDTFPRSPYRTEDGGLTAQAARGGRIFARLDCQDCHAGDILTDSPSGARHDVGTATALSGQRIGGELDGFDTPTLLGLHATAPYLHDGSAPTVRAVLDNPDHGDAGRLSSNQKDAVAAYLLSLENDLAYPGAGCACRTGGSGSAGWLLLFGGAAARRRRPRPPSARVRPQQDVVP